MNNEESRSRAFILTDYKRIQEKVNEHFSVGLLDNDIYTWEVLIFGPPDTPYEGGIYKAIMAFTKNYPEAPPKFRFLSEMWHPNIDAEASVCISILHKPGDDVYGYESIGERWLPVRHPESVIMSIVSLLNDPNCDSPANFDASKEYKENRQMYDAKVKRLAEKTLDL